MVPIRLDKLIRAQAAAEAAEEHDERAAAARGTHHALGRVVDERLVGVARHCGIRKVVIIIIVRAFVVVVLYLEYRGVV